MFSFKAFGLLLLFAEKYKIPPDGEVAERLKAHAWKVCIRQRIEGSNPSLSARNNPQHNKLRSTPTL